MFFDAFLKSLGVRRAPLKTQKKKEKRKAGGRGGAAPAKILIFEHSYVVLGPFEVGNRLLSTRSLRTFIFRAIRPLGLDFQFLGWFGVRTCLNGTSKFSQPRATNLGHRSWFWCGRRRQGCTSDKKIFEQNGVRHLVLRQILGLHVFGISSKSSMDQNLEIFRFLVRVS